MNWPLDRKRKFNSKHFTLEELTVKQQENSWLRNRDAEDGIYTEYPTYDYSYTAYECFTVEELTKAFLYGNWSIRQCFTYKNLAFINQINAGDEWLTVKKFLDGRLLAFDSCTMIRIIKHEVKSWVLDINTSEFEEGEHVRIVSKRIAEEKANERTKKFHENNKNYLNKKARYVVGDSKDPKMDFGIYFVDIARDYFPEFIEQMLKANYEQCRQWSYTDEDFKKKWRD